MIFIETAIFTENCRALLSYDEYKALQQALADNPEVGDVIAQTGGLRKVRWGAKGKRSGVRIIYYHKAAVSHIAGRLNFDWHTNMRLSLDLIINVSVSSQN